MSIFKKKKLKQVKKEVVYFKILYVVMNEGYPAVIVRTHQDKIELIGINEVKVEKGIDKLEGCYLRVTVRNGEIIRSYFYDETETLEELILKEKPTN